MLPRSASLRVTAPADEQVVGSRLQSDVGVGITRGPQGEAIKLARRRASRSTADVRDPILVARPYHRQHEHPHDASRGRWPSAVT